MALRVGFGVLRLMIPDLVSFGIHFLVSSHLGIRVLRSWSRTSLRIR
jgi:hypothetical protein